MTRRILRFLFILLIVLSVFLIINNILVNKHLNGADVLLTKPNNMTNEEFLNILDETGKDKNVTIIFSIAKETSNIYYISNLMEVNGGYLSIKGEEHYNLLDAKEYYFDKNAHFIINGESENIDKYIDDLEYLNIKVEEVDAINGNILNIFLNNWKEIFLLFIILLSLIFLEVNSSLLKLEERRIKILNGYKDITIMMEDIHYKYDLLAFLSFSIIALLIFHSQAILCLSILAETFLIGSSIILIIKGTVYYILKPKLNLTKNNSLKNLLKSYNVIKMTALIFFAIIFTVMISMTQQIISLRSVYGDYEKIDDYVITPINSTQDIDLTTQDIQNTAKKFHNFYDITVDNLEGVAIYPISFESSTLESCEQYNDTLTQGEILSNCNTIFINDNALDLMGIRDESGSLLASESLSKDKIEILVPLKYKEFININNIIAGTTYFLDNINEENFDIIYIEDNQSFFTYNSYLYDNELGYIKDGIYINFNSTYMTDTFFYGMIGNSTGDYFVKDSNIKKYLRNSKLDNTVQNFYSKGEQAKSEILKKIKILLVNFFYLSILIILIFSLIILIIKTYILENKNDIAIKKLNGWGTTYLYKNLLINLICFYIIALIISMFCYYIIGIKIYFVILFFLLLEILWIYIYSKIILDNEILKIIKERK